MESQIKRFMSSKIFMTIWENGRDENVILDRDTRQGIGIGYTCHNIMCRYTYTYSQPLSIVRSLPGRSQSLLALEANKLRLIQRIVSYTRFAVSRNCEFTREKSLRHEYMYMQTITKV